MAERPRLRHTTQIGYATADVGLNLVETAVRIYLLIFYTDEVGLRSGLAGLALGLGLILDAIADPVMGAISDRTRHRFGGRRFYLPWGGILLALGALAVFWPPPLASQTAKFGWLLFAYCFLNVGMTVLAVPFTAMAGEMTEDPHERAIVFGWRFAFANVGAIAAAGLPAVFLAGGQRNAKVMHEVGAVAAVVVVASALCSWWTTRRVQFLHPPLQHEPFFGSFAVALRDRTFRVLLAVYVVATIGIGINAAAALYYYQYRLQMSEPEIQGLLVVFMAMFTLSILGWVAAERRWGKLGPMVVGALVLGVGTSALYLAMTPGHFGFVLGVGGVGLGLTVGCVVLIEAMLTDVIDHDRVRTRRLRSGLFFGVWRFASKLARAIGLGLVALVLEVVGFVPRQAEQAEQVGTALAWLFGPGVGGFFVAAGVILWRYRFDAAKQAQVRRILARRAERTERTG